MPRRDGLLLVRLAQVIRFGAQHLYKLCTPKSSSSREKDGTHT